MSFGGSDVSIAAMQALNSFSDVLFSFQFVKVDTPDWDNYYWYGSDNWYNSWGYYGYAKTRSNNKEEQQESAQEQNDSTMLPKRFFPENK